MYKIEEPIPRNTYDDWKDGVMEERISEDVPLLRRTSKENPTLRDNSNLNERRKNREAD